MGILLRFRQDDWPLFLTFSTILGSFLYNVLAGLSFKDKSMLSNQYVCSSNPLCVLLLSSINAMMTLLRVHEKKGYH